MLYDGSAITKEINVISIVDSEETLMLEDESRSKILLKQNFGKRFVPQQELSTEQAFWFKMSNPSTESSEPSLVKVDVPSELPKVSLVNESLKKLKSHLTKFEFVVKTRITPSALTKDLLNEITKVKIVFDQMETDVQQYSVDKRCLDTANNQVLSENDRLLEQIISQDIVNSFVDINDSGNADNCNKCLKLKTELFKKRDFIEKDIYDKLFRTQLQEKDTVIYKLKERIKSITENANVEYVRNDISELETKNVELEHSVAKLLSENERLCNEMNHVKQVFKDQFDSIKKTRVRNKEQSDSLIDKLNLKSVENEDLKAQIQDKNKLKTVDKGKNVYTKFDKSETLGTLLCVTSLPKNIAVKAKKVSTSKVSADRSKPVTSHSIPTTEQRIESSNSVRRPKSKDSKSKSRVLKNTKAKSSTTHVWKMSSSVSLDSNKCETM
ncbi:hypothetical protein Tco_1027573, partial [Tanacetum coccineum]